MNTELKNIFENISSNDLSDLLMKLNRMQLNSKKHIKKYNKLRRLHGEILDSMIDYIRSGKYVLEDNFKIICNDINKETPQLNFYLDLDDEDDSTILTELFVYKNYPKLKSITEIYLEKNKFRNADKIKMLNCMKNSYVGLFKIIGIDRNEGYVTYEDVFTKKKFKVIDIALSSTLRINKNKMIYVYNRIITFDDISFGTGIHCMMTSDHKLLKKFIKNHKYKKTSDFERCLLLYDISKKDNELVVNYNNKY